MVTSITTQIASSGTVAAQEKTPDTKVSQSSSTSAAKVDLTTVKSVEDRVSATAESKERGPKLDANATQKAIAKANQELNLSGTELHFEFNDSNNQTTINVIDSQTNKVIQQIPSEAMVAAAKAIADLGKNAKGSLISTNA